MSKSITSVIKRHLHDTGTTQLELAEKLSKAPQNLGRDLKRNSLDTAYLMRICVALKRDFFSDLSADLRHELGGTSVGEPEVPYGGLTYQNLLEENVQLHRRLRAKEELIEHLKSGNASISKPELKNVKR